MPELGDISALLQRYYYSGDPEEYYMQPIADGRGGLIVLAGYNGLYVIQDKESFLRAYSHVVKNGYVKRGSRLRAVLTALPIWGLLLLVTAIYEEVSFWDWTCLAPVLYMASLAVCYRLYDIPIITKGTDEDDLVRIAVRHCVSLGKVYFCTGDEIKQLIAGYGA